MNEIAILYFHGLLKDLLRTKRNITLDNKDYKKIIYPVIRSSSIKDIIESLGIPHTEIGGLILNSKKIYFDYILHPTDNIHVYPHIKPIRPDNYLFSQPIQKYRFLVDVNVGRLAKLLRILGYDCAYDPYWDDEFLAQKAYEEKRILLSRDIQLLKRKKVLWGKLILNEDPKSQLKEVIDHFGLKIYYRPFSRCLVCNTELKPVRKKQIFHKLEPKTKRYFNQFALCPKCKKIYWAGSHVEKMEAMIKEIKRRKTNT